MRRTLALLALLTVAGVWTACSPADNTNTNANTNANVTINANSVTVNTNTSTTNTSTTNTTGNTNAGNVGVGTTNPDAGSKMEVAGKVKAASMIAFSPMSHASSAADGQPRNS